MSFLKKVILIPLVSALACSDKVFRFLFRNENIVLYYHNVTDSPTNFEKRHQLSQTVEQLRSQIEVLGSYFDWGDPSEPRNFNFDQKPKVFLTFDDGYKGTLTEGLKLLENYNIPSLHFLNFAPILSHEPYWVQVAEEGYRLGRIKKDSAEGAIFSRGNKSWVKDYESDEKWKSACKEGPIFASKADIDLADSKSGVYFGNHLYNHFNAAEQDEDFLSYLFIENAESLDKLKSNLPYFSYPFGQPKLCYNEKTVALISKLGAGMQFTTTCVSNKKQDSQLIHRFMLKADESTKFKIKYSLIEQKLRGILFFESET